MKALIKILTLLIFLLFSAFSFRKNNVIPKFYSADITLILSKNQTFSITRYNYNVKKYEKVWGLFKTIDNNSLKLEVKKLSRQLQEKISIVSKRNDKYDTINEFQKVKRYFNLHDTYYVQFTSDSTISLVHDIDTVLLIGHSKGYYNSNVLCY